MCDTERCAAAAGAAGARSARRRRPRVDAMGCGRGSWRFSAKEDRDQDGLLGQSSTDCPEIGAPSSIARASSMADPGIVICPSGSP